MSAYCFDHSQPILTTDGRCVSCTPAPLAGRVVPDVLVGTPTKEFVHVEYAQSLARDVGAGIVSSELIATRGVHVEDNRNSIWRTWVARRERFLLMVDSDVSWDMVTVAALARYALPVACPDLQLRAWPTNVFNFDDRGIPTPAPYQATPYQVDACTAGMVLFERSVIPLVGPNPWSRLASRTEDGSFADRLYRSGTRPWCVPGLYVVHHAIPYGGLTPREE